MKLKFIEIGTVGVNSLASTANMSDRGICIEPLKYYFDLIPSKPLIKKYNCAISLTEKEGVNKVYYVPEQVIKKNKFPKSLRTCFSLGDYHYQHAMMGIKDLVEIDFVAEVPLSKICEMNNVIEIDYLKINVENACKILNSFFPFLTEKTKRGQLPKKIEFNVNELTSEEEIGTTISQYVNKFMYSVQRNKQNIILELRSDI